MAFIIHSNLADSGNWREIAANGRAYGEDAIKLYYYCRMIDQRGSGRVTINIREISQPVFNRSHHSVRRWLYHGKKLGIFRSCKALGAGIYEIYYTGLVKAAIALGVEDLGACFEAELSDLAQLKFKATEAIAMRLQQQSRYLAKKATKAKVPKPAQLTQSSHSARGGILRKAGQRFCFVMPAIPVFGGRQSTAARRMGRSLATIQRRLDNAYRHQHGIAPLDKCQLAVADHNGLFNKYWDSHSHNPTNRWFKPSWHRSLYFKCCNNIYNSPVQLRSVRWQRSKLNHALISSANSNLATAGRGGGIVKNYLSSIPEAPKKEG